MSVSGDCQADQCSEPSPPPPHASPSSTTTPKFVYPGSFPTSAANSPSLPVSPTHDTTPAPQLLSTAPEDHYSLLETRQELPHSPPSLKSPKSFARSRQSRTTAEEVPRQTLLKALASNRPSLSPLSLTPMSIAPGLRQSIMTAAAQNSPRYIISQNGAEHHNNTGLNEYAIEASAAMLSPTSRSSAGMEPLQSPCFYHQRFDKTVNVDRVLEEIAGDEYRSHSRLMQTALGVREVARQLQRRTCKVAVKNVMIVTKARDNELVTLTRELAHWLMKTPRYGRRLGVNVYVDKKLRNSARFNADGLLEEEPEFKKMLKYWTPDLCWSSPESFDLVLTLGGDGTVLFTSWLFQRIVPPVLSFSLGSLGFLTNFKYDLYRETLDKVLNDGLRVNMRMRFTCTVYREEDGESVEKDQFEVLNELVIDRGPSPYVSQLELYGDNDLLTVVQADGCIFSTPTGSTAYSLSAGGSLVHPDIPAILLTPICPHSLSFRPMLLNDSMLLRVSVPKGSRATAWCAFDGKGRLELCPGDFVSIAASQYPFPTVLSNSTEWIDSISRTLRWNTRGAQQKPWNSVDQTEPEVWDIDTDSGVYNSDDEESDGNSPVGRKMALLGLA
ncbi:NAD kinase associated with ferric reductase [Tricharina praecox]|uniref:NAD kinase associated with ferric reductase n=1 Tax=Tricharina praecox TaxID=43433 RepID=UPI00221FC786|nr:NAD kinase associated with ferric reductase [Tricharina praecox]KAI5853809.1 NAD kinase associated with ferric reductase [Tricharina praecox]